MLVNSNIRVRVPEAIKKTTDIFDTGICISSDRSGSHIMMHRGRFLFFTPPTRRPRAGRGAGYLYVTGRGGHKYQQQMMLYL
jgi:hypothetical protein